MQKPEKPPESPEEKEFRILVQGRAQWIARDIAIRLAERQADIEAREKAPKIARGIAKQRSQVLYGPPFKEAYRDAYCETFFDIFLKVYHEIFLIIYREIWQEVYDRALKEVRGEIENGNGARLHLLRLSA